MLSLMKIEVSDELRKKIKEKIEERKKLKKTTFGSFWTYAIWIPLIFFIILVLLSS